MNVEFTFSMYDEDERETEYTIRAVVTPGSPGCTRRHVGGHGDPDNCEAPYGPEVEIDEIRGDPSSIIEPKEWAAHGFSGTILRDIEKRALAQAEGQDEMETDE